jgi:hypothetical protein
MLRLIFLSQAILYLLIMPAVHDYMDIVYRPPLGVAALAIISLLAGFALFNRSYVGKPVGAVADALPDLKPRNIVLAGFAVFAILYAYVSYTNGLLNRRQGSEAMADIYGNLPLIELLILRVYEIAFVPIAVIFFFSRSSLASRLSIAAILILSLPFMGIQDSRARILVMAITLLSFVKAKDFIVFFYKNTKIYVLMAVAVGIFVFMSVRRASSYARLEDYFFIEVVKRLDGLNLVTELRDYGLLNYLGSFDMKMFGPLISKIPFLEAGRIAKIEGLTSTKQYFLKTVLNSSRIDDSNSIILDPLYFGGIVGMIIAFVGLGYFIARSDRYIAEGRLFSSYAGLAAALAFVTSFSVIETDFITGIINFAQNVVLLFALVLVVMTRPTYRKAVQGVTDIGASAALATRPRSLAP